LRIIDIYVFFTAILITYIEGGTPAQIFFGEGVCNEDFEHFDEKRAITPKWVMGFTSKLRGR
jgi:hypothetical protein